MQKFERCLNFAKECVRLSLQSSFHTTKIHRVRGPRKLKVDPGISSIIKSLDENDQFVRDIESIEDLEQLEDVNFENTDESYVEHEQEIRKRKQCLQQKITIQKFFKPPKQPNMLTWNEREQIKFLHHQDPDEWCVDKLVESFPATRETILKILKSKWKPASIEKCKKMDQIVQDNWKLLEEGKLEADTKAIEHFKKFTSRHGQVKELSLPELNYLEEPKKEEPKWNNGHLRSIIEGYEKTIKMLEERSKENNTTETLPSLDGKSLVKDRINLESVDVKENPGEFLLGNESSERGKMVTLEKLKHDIIKSAVRGKDLSLLDKIILDHTLSTEKSQEGNNFKNIDINTTINERGEDSNIKLKLSNLAGYDIGSIKENEGKGKGSKNFTKKPDNIIFKTKSSNIQMKKGDVKFNEFRKPKESDNVILQSNDVNVENFEETKKGDVKFEQFLESESIKKGEVESNVILGYDVKDEREKVSLEKEEESIQNTFFWKDSNKKEYIEGEDMKAVSEVSKYRSYVQGKDISYEYKYPERIKIPKNQRGTGLTFKVDDCYYDDDGEFLYRVPGMKN